MEPPPRPVVVGRFPPPLDGQSVATRRLASLLAEARPVETFDLNPGGEALVQSRVRFRPDAALHFLRERRRLGRFLAARADAPVLWTTISPTPLGHLRDALAVGPALPRGRAWAVVHHGRFHRVFERASTRPTALRLVRRLAGVVFLSGALAERCAPWLPPERRAVIPNTVDPALVPDARALAAARDERAAALGAGGPLRVLFLSHLIPSKGHLDLVRAVGRLRQRGVAVEATFVGRWDAPDGEAAFHRVAAEAGAGGAVRYAGSLTERGAIGRAYLGAHVLALPTYYPAEAQPLSVVEALAAGTPVAVTPHASLPETVREGREGHFAPPRDPDALADALARFADAAHWRALSDGARTRFDRAFSPDVVRRQWLALLDVGTRALPSGPARRRP